ncbi:MAG: hypothetical protein WCP15_01775 [bacterium]
MKTIGQIVKDAWNGKPYIDAFVEQTERVSGKRGIVKRAVDLNSAFWFTTWVTALIAVILLAVLILKKDESSRGLVWFTVSGIVMIISTWAMYLYEKVFSKKSEGLLIFLEGLDLLGQICPEFKKGIWKPGIFLEESVKWLFLEGDELRSMQMIYKEDVWARTETLLCRNFQILQRILPIPGADYHYYLNDENKPGGGYYHGSDSGKK